MRESKIRSRMIGSENREAQMQPRRYNGKRPLKVTAEIVFAAVKGIIEAGHEEQFLSKCAERGLVVTVAPDDVNFAKTYLFDEGLHTRSVMARRVVDSDRCTP